MAIEAFKIIHGTAPPCLHDCLSLKESRYNFRYTNILQVPQVRTTTYGKKSFNMQQQCYGTVSQKNLEKLAILVILNHSSHIGMGGGGL